MMSNHPDYYLLGLDIRYPEPLHRLRHQFLVPEDKTPQAWPNMLCCSVFPDNIVHCHCFWNRLKSSAPLDLAHRNSGDSTWPKILHRWDPLCTSSCKNFFWIGPCTGFWCNKLVGVKKYILGARSMVVISEDVNSNITKTIAQSYAWISERKEDSYEQGSKPRERHRNHNPGARHSLPVTFHRAGIQWSHPWEARRIRRRLWVLHWRRSKWGRVRCRCEEYTLIIQWSVATKRGKEQPSSEVLNGHFGPESYLDPREKIRGSMIMRFRIRNFDTDQ